MPEVGVLQLVLAVDVEGPAVTHGEPGGARPALDLAIFEGPDRGFEVFAPLTDPRLSMPFRTRWVLMSVPVMVPMAVSSRA